MVILSYKKGFDRLIQQLSYSVKPFLVIIAGGTCVGKTYLARQLAVKLMENAYFSSIIPLDLYFCDINDPKLPKDSLQQPLFDLPNSYRHELFVTDVASLITGKFVYLPNYNLASNKLLPGLGQLILAESIIIAEGLYTLFFLNKSWAQTIRVFIDLEEEIMLARRLERDVAQFGVNPKLVKKFFFEKILPYHRQFIIKQKELADIIIYGQEGGQTDGGNS